MSKLLIACLLVGGAVGLTACSPPIHPQNRVEWNIINSTVDTLLLSVGYRLDSALVDPADVSRNRQVQTSDSLLQRYEGQRYREYPLDRLVWHRGRWYWVRNVHVTASPTWRDTAGKLHAAAVNRETGVITYKLVPGGEHQLATEFCLPCDSLSPALPSLISLRLRQGQAQRTLPTGAQLKQLFQEQPHLWQAWLDWGQPTTTYGYELRVGPGLTLND